MIENLVFHFKTSFSSQPAISVWFGDIPKKNATEEYKKTNLIRIKEIILHPGYNENTFFRNIGLAQLEKDIVFDQRRYPACLSTHVVNENEEKPLILSSYEMVQRNIPLTNYSICNDFFDMRDVLESEQFCATVQTNCDYPTGSVLQRRSSESEKIFDILGIVSLRKDCKLTESQLVFVEVSVFVNWIEQIVRNTEN